MSIDEAPPLYQQIAGQLAELVRNGTLARGEKRPSVRALARQHGVAQAFHWLEDARLVVARPRSGFFVAPRAAALPEPTEPAASRPRQHPRAVSVDWLGQRIRGTRSRPVWCRSAAVRPGLRCSTPTVCAAPSPAPCSATATCCAPTPRSPGSRKRAAPLRAMPSGWAARWTR